MRAKIIAFAQEPMKQQFTMKITMSLEDWKALLEQLSTKEGNAYPAWHVKTGISDILHQAEQVFTHEIDA